MKKLIVLILSSFISFGSFSQSNTMTSVLGIELGSSKSQVRDLLMSKQPECKVYSTTDVSMTFENVKWGAYKTYLVIFQFSEDKLHTAMIFLEPDHCQNVFTLYDDVCEILSERYFTTDKKIERYSYPYERGDKYKYTESMVKNGKVTMQSFWTFNTRNTPENDDDNNIKVAVSDDCLVIVTYQDGVLIKEAVAKKKQKESNDY